MGDTIRTTVADAIVRFLVAQRIDDDRDGIVKPLIPGVMAIFGHGNALALGESLEAHRDAITTYRGQHEGAMGLAAVGYAKAARRRQVMAVTTSIGPGALNAATAAGVAFANRLPVLFLLGDTFASRLPDPVLQQLEHFGDPTVTANDALRPVSRYWDRITVPSQLLKTLRQAIAVLLDPADCGPVTLALPQDVQAMAWDFPAELFAPVVHRIARPRPSLDQLTAAVEALRSAQRPVIIAGGGVHYSLAESELARFANTHGVPVLETVAGKSSLNADDPAFAGPAGVFGEASSIALARDADLVLAVGTRLQDFTTESGTMLAGAQVVAVNAARFDALKRGALPVVGDARASLAELSAALGTWRAPMPWWERARTAVAEQAAERAARTAVGAAGPVPTYAQVIGVVHEAAGEDDYVVTAAGGLPGELVMNWSSKSVASFDCEYGFSCMGYEISGTWGAALERAVSKPGSTVFGMTGDGSFMMLPMDVYSAVLHGTSLILIACDNGGYHVIERLQVGHGAASFRTMLADHAGGTGPADRPGRAPGLDLAAMVRAMGANAVEVADLHELRTALAAVRGRPGVHVLVTPVAQHHWSEGGSFWEVGVPEVSTRPAVDEARARVIEGKRRQRW